MHTAEVQAAGDSNTREGYRKWTYLSGNSTGFALILLCKANMFSSINGHWGGERRETKESQWIVPEFSCCQENKNSNGLQAYIHLYKWTGQLPHQDRTIVSVWQAHISLRWLCSRFTCLPEDKTVEGDAHGPQVQSLGESEHYFRGLNTDFQPCYAGAKGILKL